MYISIHFKVDKPIGQEMSISYFCTRSEEVLQTHRSINCYTSGKHVRVMNPTFI